MTLAESIVSNADTPQSTGIDWEKVKARLKVNEEALARLFNTDPAKNKIVFQERAQRMAARIRDQVHSETITVLSFQVGKERYCLPISELSEIIPYTACTPIPGCPPELKGAISIRGEIHCVVDLASVLAVPLLPATENQGYILLLRHDGLEVGLKVCLVDQVEAFDKAVIENQSAAASGMIGHYLKGVGSNSLIFLNLSQVLSHPIFKGVA